MNLPGSSLKSAELLSDKDLYRNLLQQNGFHSPKFVIYDPNEGDPDLSGFIFPLVVKPVDSSDTKGVNLIHSTKQISAAVNKALPFSKKKKIIIEEFVNSDMANLHGDAFVADGEIKFCMLGDRIFSSLSNPLKPSTERYPGRISDKLLAEVQNEVSEIIQKCGFSFGSINIEARVDRQCKISIMEIGPRSGGTLTPQTMRYSTGYDMLKATFDYFKII